METVRLMSRGSQTFKNGVLAKALKEAADAGLSVNRFEIDRDGKIVVIAGQPDKSHSAGEETSAELRALL
ncbi:hypothetical protein [Bradyrhizobium sp. RP6]|uniref:hypothetical protein n=1 Tax=Bradyrhizobium sp. RP6 TaxID=2489596 RepID=UPI000F535A7F|nr:hypothetical protein [Bradyrhizobium sp. RP6]RQH15685.1 hypothetical protein EHH60_00340 [Bradyrhizobium sp. RP6]